MNPDLERAVRGFAGVFSGAGTLACDMLTLGQYSYEKTYEKSHYVRRVCADGRVHEDWEFSHNIPEKDLGYRKHVTVFGERTVCNCGPRNPHDLVPEGHVDAPPTEDEIKRKKAREAEDAVRKRLWALAEGEHDLECEGLWSISKEKVEALPKEELVELFLYLANEHASELYKTERFC